MPSILSAQKFLLTFFLGYVLLVVAIPTWEGLNGRSSIGSLVPGAAYIEAMGPARGHDYQTRHLSVQILGAFPRLLFRSVTNHILLINLGQPGNLTLTPNTRAPPLFYINRNQLWQYNNETAIYYVNVMNTTKTSHFPLQLVLGKRKTGFISGIWQWRGTMLYYDQGQKGLTGLYYNCPAGLFMYLQPYVAHTYVDLWNIISSSLSRGATPAGCELVTLHSFSRNYMDQKDKQ